MSTTERTVLSAEATDVRMAGDGTPVSTPVDGRAEQRPNRDLRPGDFVWRGQGFWKVTKVGNVTPKGRVRVTDALLLGGALCDADRLVWVVPAENAA